MCLGAGLFLGGRIGICLTFIALSRWRSERPQPRIEAGDIKFARIEHLHHLCIDLRWRPLQASSIDSQEHVGCREGDALVAVHKRVIDRQTFHQGSRLGNDIVVVARLWPEKSCL